MGLFVGADFAVPVFQLLDFALLLFGQFFLSCESRSLFFALTANTIRIFSRLSRCFGS